MCPTIVGLDENSAIPLYEQLADILRERIRTGELKPEDPLPTELELAQTYNVSRTTARQAVLALVQEGLAYRQRGKGSFVCQPRVVQQLVTLRSFSEEIRILGFRPGARLLGQTWVPAETGVARSLGIKTGEPVLEVVRLRLADEDELSLNKSYFAAEYGKILEKEDLGAPSLYQTIERVIGSITRATELITATSATQEHAKLLGIPQGSALLRLERTTHISGGYPLEFVRADFRPDRYTFYVELIS